MSGDDAGGPCTVIATAAVPEGMTSGFLRLQERISAAMAEFPGFLGKELIRPRPGLQDAWVSVFRFSSTAALRRWLASPQRGEMLRELEALTAAPPVLQVVAGDDEETPPVAVVFSHRVKPGREVAFRAWREEMLRLMSGAPGFLGAEVSDRRDGVQDEWVHIVRFDSPASLERWMTSAGRRRQIGRLAGLVEGYTAQPLASGLGGWFTFDDSPGAPAPEPPRWKQVLLVTLALYPTVLGLAVLLDPWLDGVPFPVHLVVSNLLCVSLLTWVVMPWLNRRLGWWLHGWGGGAAGTLLVVGLLGAMVAVFTLVWAGKFAF